MDAVELPDLLGPGRYERAVSVARERHVPVDVVIEEAIDRGLRPSQHRRAATGARILQAAPMSLGTVEDLLTELDEARGRRG